MAKHILSLEYCLGSIQIKVFIMLNTLAIPFLLKISVGLHMYSYTNFLTNTILKKMVNFLTNFLLSILFSSEENDDKGWGRTHSN